MPCSLKKGFSFGLTSGIITTLGLMVGLHSGTHSKTAVIAGIFVIAVADALSDAMGMHISEEIENRSVQQVWVSTITTLLAKFFFALTFIVPVLVFPLMLAIVVSILWGVSLIALFSFFIARQQQVKPHKVILEHVGLTILVVAIAHSVGDLVAKFAQ